MRILKAETTAMRQEAAPAARPDDAPAVEAPAVGAPEQPARTGEPSTRTTYP